MSSQTLSASKNVTASGTTGSIVQTSGPYKFSGPIDIIVYLARGDKFPDAPVPVATSMDAASKNAAQASWSMVTDDEASSAPTEK